MRHDSQGLLLVIKTHLACVRRSPEVRVLIPEIACVCELVTELGMLGLGKKPGSQLEASEPWVWKLGTFKGSGGGGGNWVVLGIFWLA